MPAEKKFLESGKIKIAKAIAELRFKPRLDYYDRLFKVGQNFVEHYPQWVTSWQELTLSNVKLRRNLILRHHVWSQMFEHPDSTEWLSDVYDIFPKVTNEFGFTDSTRFGFRVQTYRPLSVTFEEAVKLFSMLNRSTELRKLPFIMDQISDDSLILNCQQDGWRYHFEIGPSRKEEIIGRSNYSFEDSQDLVSDSPSFLWVDVDVSMGDFELTKFRNIVDDAIAKSAERIDGLHAFFEG